MAESNIKQVSTENDFKQPLIDDHGRRVRKLRISLLEDCNLRCFYCMPKNVKFPHHSKRMPVDEICRLVRVMLDYGVEQIKKTYNQIARDYHSKDLILNPAHGTIIWKHRPLNQS